MLDGQVPLLGVRQAVRIKGAIVAPAVVCGLQPLTVECIGTDKRGTSEILRKSLAKKKGGFAVTTVIPASGSSNVRSLEILIDGRIRL
jgi:hypothetical protein